MTVSRPLRERSLACGVKDAPAPGVSASVIEEPVDGAPACLAFRIACQNAASLTGGGIGKVIAQ